MYIYLDIEYIQGGVMMAKKEHDAVRAAKGKNDNSRATALVSMKPEEKERFTRIAENHGLSLSAFFRLAVNEYIENHNW